jgi:hypothetical protein
LINQIVNQNSGKEGDYEPEGVASHTEKEPFNKLQGLSQGLFIGNVLTGFYTALGAYMIIS